MFRRDTPSTPPRAAPPALPPGEMTPTRATPIPIRDRSATPRPRTPEGASPNDRPDTPRYPTWTLIPRASNSPPFLSYATVDGGETGSSSPPSPIDWDRMRMEWDEEVRAENNAAAAAAAAAANNNDYEYSDGDDDDYSDDDLLSPHATLTARLAALIALPSPPSYAELDRRMSQIRALSATLTFLNAPTPTTTTTTTGIIPSSTTTTTTDTNTNTNTNTTPLDTLILSEYRAHLAREAATTATSTAAAHGAAVQRAVAEITAEVRSALQQAGLADNEALFNSIITAAQATIIAMLPGGPLWAADVVRWVPAETLVRPGVAREQAWQMQRNRDRDRGDVQLDYGGRLPAGRMGVVGRGGGGRRAEVLTRAELPRGARVPRSAGVSGRVWPDARTMTAEEIAEYNREAVRQDREEEARWQLQREEERRREVEAERLREEEERMEEEEEERLREVREVAARRLIAAVEEGMRGG